ncbi:MAG: glucose-1-phosphate cytidylyltransferase [Cyclobacteriaceae bacterium]|jgi:glucose-1-phosphate cytidylyltransferase
MKVVIFAGGYGTRLMEETEARPKPMVEIGGKPILWHIMKSYSNYGFNEFIICLGYKGYMIKEYFTNYFLHNSDITVNLSTNDIKIHESKTEKFTVTLIDTGLTTKTAGRLQRVRHLVGNETFMLTYGDGLSDISIAELVNHHRQHGKIATITSIQPSGRFGSLDIDENNQVTRFIEKPKGDGFWINAGFFVLEPTVFDFLPTESDAVMWEDDPLANLAKAGELTAYKYSGFWKCMDHLRDKIELESIWASGQAPWKVW